MISADKKGYKAKIKDPTLALREKPESENKLQQWRFEERRKRFLMKEESGLILIYI